MCDGHVFLLKDKVGIMTKNVLLFKINIFMFNINLIHNAFDT